MKKIIKVVRKIISFPFLVIGYLSFRITEVLSGEMMTYRAQEVKNWLLAEWQMQNIPGRGSNFSKSKKRRK
jgi:hypothetical protein